MTIKNYIDENLPKCIRYNPESSDTLIGLPYPYIVPCASGAFQEMYYWDTFFTHKGLIARGNLEQVRNDIDNMRYLIREFGFVLNGNRTNFLYNSQPPFLSMMMRDYYEETKDREWLKGAYEDLKLEHDFWMSERSCDIELNRYDCMPLSEEMTESAAQGFRDRTGLCKEESNAVAAKAMISSGESGWDMNPRMADKTYQFAPADLNSLLYAMEDNLKYFAEELGKKEEAKKWFELSKKRAELCRQYLKNTEGLFMDYNYAEHAQTSIFSAACFYPLYCGMATEEEAKAARNSLFRIETDHGVVTCEKNDVCGIYQWDYPNGWAPMQLMVAGGLLRYGFWEDAYRIAGKFVALVEKCYEKTGHLWEKYNVIDGDVNVQNEYEMPPMLGWTFGVYTWLKEVLKNERRD